MQLYSRLNSFPRPFYITGVFVWAAVILFILLLPSNSVPRLQIPHADKVVHAGLFFVLAWFLWHALSHSGARIRRPLLTVLLTAGYGALTEYIQLSAATRTADAFDAAADTLGAVLLVLLMLRSRKTTPSRDGS